MSDCKGMAHAPRMRIRLFVQRRVNDRTISPLTLRGTSQESARMMTYLTWDCFLFANVVHVCGVRVSWSKSCPRQIKLETGGAVWSSIQSVSFANGGIAGFQVLIVDVRCSPVICSTRRRLLSSSASFLWGPFLPAVNIIQRRKMKI